MKVAALCAGYGGLELGLGLAGVDVDLAWYAEIDPNASKVMAAHYPHVPNLGDLTQIDDCPQVDVVTAGFPCQPVSVAGKRKGINDERWLIDDVVQVACRASADWLILENVPGLLSANSGDAMARVISALAAGGFSAEWTCVRASDVGAPHQRLRWFCVAYTKGTERGGTEHELLGASVGSAAEHRERDSETTPDADIQRAQVPDRGQLSAIEKPIGDGKTRRTKWGPYTDAVTRWEPIVGRPAPDPTDDRRRLNPRFVEWMMGLEDGWVCDHVDGRSHQLRILGNGVVPQQAAHAYNLLQKQILER